MNSSVGVSFSSSASTSLGLILEQEEWEDGVGVVTKEYIVKHIASLLGYGSTPPTIECGVNSLGYYESAIIAYPYDADLVYDIGISHGYMADNPTIYRETITQSVDFSHSKTQALDYPVHEEGSLTWLMGPWDYEGNDVDPTELAFSGNTATTTTKVYGTAAAVYETIAHRYSITVPARGAVENKYESVVWARWDGGYTYEELTSPDNAEDAEDQEVTCYDTVSISSDDPFTAPYADDSNETVEIDYCTQTEI